MGFPFAVALLMVGNRSISQNVIIPFYVWLRDPLQFPVAFCWMQNVCEFVNVGFDRENL
jgi:hypothetical protein